MITRNIGKNTLGDNNKMKVHLKTYNRSTHNLSTVFRNTQSVGTLVPFISIPMCKDDTFKNQTNTKCINASNNRTIVRKL